MNIRKFVAVSLVAAGAMGAGLAQARSDVQWSVQIAGPIGVVVGNQPYGHYARPGAVPVYVQPAYVQPAYVQPAYRYPTRWDRDGDGIPNRYDRVYNPRWDRDGDGVPNRYDRRDDRRDARDDRRDDRRDDHHRGGH